MWLINDYTVLDYETYDPFIDTNNGGSWVYRLLYPEYAQNAKRVLLCTEDDSDEELYTWSHLQESNQSVISDKECIFHNNPNKLIGQNIIFDIGWYLTNFKTKEAAVTELRKMYKRGLLLIDTKILAKLVNERMPNKSFSLDSLLRVYSCENVKEIKELADACWDSGLYQKMTSTEKRKVKTKPKDLRKLTNVAYAHMDLMPKDVVLEYCKVDVKGTKELYELFIKKLIDEYKDEDKVIELLKIYSNAIYCLIEMRITGVAIDNTLLKKSYKEVSKKLDNVINNFKDDITKADIEFPKKWSFSQQSGGLKTLLLQYCRDVLKFKDNEFIYLESGNLSINEGWFSSHNQYPFMTNLSEIFKLQKLLNTYLTPIMEIQSKLNLLEQPYGRLHAEFNLYEASTGRFSSTNPNLQNIPKHDKYSYKICRSLFCAGEGRKLIKRDYDGQENRFMAHFGSILGAGGADELCDKWNANPLMSFHKMTGDLAGLEKPEAKCMNFGLCYGKSEGNICLDLGLPTITKTFTKNGRTREYQAPGPEGRALLDKYYKLMPFVKQLSNVIQSVCKKQGYVKSIIGRHIHTDGYNHPKTKKFIPKYYSMFNHFIQGSSADQLIVAMCKYYDYKVNNEEFSLDLNMVVHDEAVCTGDEDKLEHELPILDEFFTKAIPLKVVTPVSGFIGDCWYQEKGDD